MNCRKAKSILISNEPLLIEHRALSEHLAVCSQCAVEAERFSAISKALHEMNIPVKTPDGLASRVISRLRSESAKQKEVYFPAPYRRFRWSQAWKRSLAAAAAVVLLFGGSVGIAARLGAVNFSRGPSLVATHTPSNKPAARIPVQIPKTRNTPEVQSPKNSLPEPRQTTNKPTAQQTTTQRTTTEPRVFLNVPRSIECILWKIKVVNINDTTDKMLAWAKTNGISYSVENEIPLDNGRKINIFRFEMPKARADEFSNFISGLGNILESDRNTRDISNEFADKLERYHSLLAKKETSDGQQTKKLDTEIKAVESELTLMDKEAQDQVVFIVWFQN